MGIHAETRLGYVHLTASNLNRSLDFYRQSLGFKVHWQENGSAGLGAGRHDLLKLTENPQAKRVRGVTGLYHFAILVPSRLELARSLRRLAQTQTPLEGMADHGVSEALYLPDPDGNGIEIYRDRPRAEWPIVNGQLQMTVDPLDAAGVLAEPAENTEAGLAPTTVLGHMHLHVSHLAEAETFYREVIGFEVMQHFGGQAAFLAAGGYHHHLGLNTWAGVGAPPPPENAVGLRYFVINLPEQAELGRLVERARRANWPFEEQSGGIFLRDSSRNGVLVAVG